uniref:Ig-like domain-containing protein n=1 Tax=Neovison vison TaxID=452646 RepID=A0A8C7B499_NEOVI
MGALGWLSGLKPLPSVQVMVSGSWDRAQCWALCSVGTNSSLSVSVDTKAVLPCPPDTPTALVVTWTISPRDQPPCTRAHRRDNNETSERNCTDARISWESRPDQNPALQIDPVAITHDGCYRCEVAAADGLFGHTYYLRVLVPPKVTLFRGINGTVVCRAAAGKPSAQIFWTPEGDCDTEEEPLGNGTVTVESKCHWEDLQVSNVSCSVSHVTGNKSLFLELETGDQLSLNLTILYITSSISVALVIAGSIWLWRIGCCRYSVMLFLQFYWARRGKVYGIDGVELIC